METHVGVVREADGLAAAEAQLAPLAATCDAALVASLIAKGALARQESRGGHWRSDYPHQAPARHTETVLDRAGIPALAE
ncbi:hypothetical protein ACFQFG_14240 [Methylobacterium persicinum]